MFYYWYAVRFSLLLLEVVLTSSSFCASLAVDPWLLVTWVCSFILSLALSTSFFRLCLVFRHAPVRHATPSSLFYSIAFTLVFQMLLGRFSLRSACSVCDFCWPNLVCVLRFYRMYRFCCTAWETLCQVGRLCVIVKQYFGLFCWVSVLNIPPSIF